MTAPRKGPFGFRETRTRSRRDLELVRRYGITEAQYQRMLALQNGGCAICGRPPKTRALSVDHEHQTGRVRGLLCHQCNRHLVGKNTPGTAAAVLAYLRRDFDGRLLGGGAA